MVYIVRLLFFTFIITILFAGDKEALREDVLNDPAFQKVWFYLENKDVPKDYIVIHFLIQEYRFTPRSLILLIILTRKKAGMYIGKYL